MSKYNRLWDYIKKNGPEVMSFDEVEAVCGFPIDHSFLTYKKELLSYGYKIKKISLNGKTISLEKNAIGVIKT